MSDQTQGGAPPQGGQQGGQAGALDEDRVAKIAADVVNAAWTNRSKKLREDLENTFKTGLEGITKQIAELGANAGGGQNGKTGGGKGKKDDDDDPKLNGLQRQLNEMKTALESRDKELAAEKAKQKLAELRQTATDELGRLGITEAPRVKAALATLFSEGRIARDDDGNPIFVENANSTVDLATGIRAWGKTDDAKIFLPPSGARGSGDGRRPGDGNNRPGPKTNEVTDADLGLALAREFGGFPVG